MDPQQYTIQILDKDESTDLVTSKQSCLIGRSLISDIRIHLPSVKEMHLEIDMKNKRVTAYGQDVKVNDVEVGVNVTVDYEYGDVVSLRNKRFVVHKNKEHREGKGLPLIVSAENAFGEQIIPPTASLKGRFNMSPNRPRRSEDAASTSCGPVDDRSSADNAGYRRVHEEKETLPEEDSEKSTRPSFFNATDSSIDNIIAREKEIVESEIKNNIDFDVNVLQTSVSAKSTKPMDLKEAVLEKTVLEDIIDSKQDAVEVKAKVKELADRGEIPRKTDSGASEAKDHSEGDGIAELGCFGGADTVDAARNVTSNTINVRSEVLLVTEKTISAADKMPSVFATDLLETPSKNTENKASFEQQPSEETLHEDSRHMISGEPVEQKINTSKNGDQIHITDHAEVSEKVEKEASASEGIAEDNDGVTDESAKRRSVDNNLAGETSKKESEMANTKYSSPSKRVENLVDSLKKEEECRASMGVLAKKTGLIDETSMKSETPQKRAASQKKKEELPGKRKNLSQAETGAASKSERNLPKKKADANKKETSTAPKSKEKGGTADEPQRKKIRLASAASQQDAALPQKSRRKAAVPEKTSAKNKVQHTTIKKDAVKKKAPATARKKKEDDAAEKKKKKKKTSRK